MKKNGFIITVDEAEKNIRHELRLTVGTSSEWRNLGFSEQCRRVRNTLLSHFVKKELNTEEYIELFRRFDVAESYHVASIGLVDFTLFQWFREAGLLPEEKEAEIARGSAMQNFGNEAWNWAEVKGLVTAKMTAAYRESIYKKERDAFKEGGEEAVKQLHPTRPEQVKLFD